MAEITTNPFRFGALALGQAFADRRREIAELERDIVNGQDVVILAPRRYGKSSLLWRVRQELIARRVLVAQVDLMTAPTKERFAEKLAEAIHEEIASPLYRARETALGVFRGLRITPTITIDPNTGSVSFTFEPGRRNEDVDATLDQLLALPGQIGAERKRKVALMFDEFQEVVEIDPALPNLMRAVFQLQPEVSHVYAGSKRHMMRRIFDDENEPFWRSAKQLELSVIPGEDFRTFIDERFRATRKSIDSVAIDRILALTDGHPYATQELCYFVWEATPDRRTVAPGQVEDALEAVLRSENAHFSLLWDAASAAQRVLLEALAVEPGRPYSAAYRRRHGLPPQTNVQRALTGLVRNEIVAKRTDGTYAISEPFLAQWITRAS